MLCRLLPLCMIYLGLGCPKVVLILRSIKVGHALVLVGKRKLLHVGSEIWWSHALNGSCASLRWRYRQS